MRTIDTSLNAFYLRNFGSTSGGPNSPRVLLGWVNSPVNLPPTEASSQIRGHNTGSFSGLQIASPGNAASTISFYTSAGSSLVGRWAIGSDGTFTPAIDNATDIGTSLSRVRNLLMGGILTCGGFGSTSSSTGVFAATTGFTQTSPIFQVARSSAETVGGKTLFAELYQNDNSATPTVPETYISLRFHHSGRYWHRIETRNDGFHLKNGNLTSDLYVPISTGGLFSSISTSTGSFGTSGLDMSSPIAATSPTVYENSPALLLKASIWSASAAVTKYTGFQTQGISGLPNRYGMRVASTDVSQVAWFDGQVGGFSVGGGVLPSGGVGAGIVNADTGFKIAHAAAGGQYLRGDGTKFVGSSLLASDLSGDAKGVVPVGAIVAWAKNIVSGLSIPSNFVECNGQSVTINGQAVTLPNLNGSNDSNKYFLRGASAPASGTIASSVCHNHVVQSSSTAILVPASGTSQAVITSVTTPTLPPSTNNLPPCYEVVFVIRIS